MTTNNLFGSTRQETATPGSYGEVPSGFRLPESTRLGEVRLQIADLERSLRYYEATLGLRELHREPTRAALGAQGSDACLVELVERKGAHRATRGVAGLFHFAILLPDRQSLGSFAQHLASTGTRAGSADHLVSEAFYLTDPDGLGIEVYADRPRSQWQRAGRELMMATDPLNIESLMGAAGDRQWSGMPAGTAMGHVHLHVGDLCEARAFYSEGLGFDRMTWSYPGALFLSAGGYHHHLGTNTWAGAGARPPAEDAARLLEWAIELPTLADVESAARSVAGAGYEVQRARGVALFRDPWGTMVRVRAAGE